MSVLIRKVNLDRFTMQVKRTLGPFNNGSKYSLVGILIIVIWKKYIFEDLCFQIKINGRKEDRCINSTLKRKMKANYWKGKQMHEL